MFLSLLALLVACEHENNDNPSGFTTCVNFPEAPIEIMSNLDESTSDFDCKYINYFNIVQVKDNLYYMYYAAKGKYSGETDIEQGLFFAYSNDAIHWKRETPDGGSNILLQRGIQEQSVFKIESDSDNPYRLIASIKEDGKYKLCLWKSKNGYDFDFTEKKVGFIYSGARSNKKEYFDLEKDRFNRSNTPNGGTLYIFDDAQKEQSDGYDAAIVYWSKRLIPIQDVIKRLR